MCHKGGQRYTTKIIDKDETTCKYNKRTYEVSETVQWVDEKFT